MQQACEQAILEYAPYYRQINALKSGEYRDYVETVIVLHRNHYAQLVESGASEWTDLPAAQIQWLNENKPY